MQYISRYMSVLGEMVLACDEEGLCGVWFAGQKYFGAGLENGTVEQKTEILQKTEQWLERYFSHQEPGEIPPLHLQGTPFQIMVWEELLKIPYGETVTYGELARKTAQRLGKEHMSAQAVGGAVGHNPVSVLVPCHRVIGSNGSLTGYAGGVEKKEWLLRHEKEHKGEYLL